MFIRPQRESPMLTRLRCFSSTVLCLATFSAVAAQAAVVDQSQPLTTGISGFVSSTIRAQTFTVGLAGDLVGVDLYLRNSTTSPNTIDVSIQGLTAAGAPDGIAIANHNVTLPTGTMPIAWYYFDLSADSPAVAPGQSYAIVIKSLTPAGLNAGASDGSTDLYSGGKVLDYFGSTWSTYIPSLTLDYSFHTYMVVPEPTSLGLLGLMHTALRRRRPTR